MYKSSKAKLTTEIYIPVITLRILNKMIYATLTKK